MGISKNEGLESASLLVLSSGEPITPATITFIEVPDYDYVGSGSAIFSGEAEHFVGITKTLESSWSILGEFESGFTSEWNVGEGDYYWYRVEGSCGEMRCDTTGVVQDECRRMSFMTVVGARNLEELCRNLANPVLNPRVDFKLSSIKKYSRPITRSSSDLCNVLEAQEFCQVAECLDYCIDQDAVEVFSFSMRAIETDIIAEMSGGIRIFGQVQTDRNKYYEPQFPVIGFSGVSEAKIIVRVPVSPSIIVLSGSSESKSSSYDFFGGGTIHLGGFARTVSPSRKYSDMDGGVDAYGSARLYFHPASEGEVGLSGSAESFLLMDFRSSGKVELSGRLLDYTSPKFNNLGSGSVFVEGSASYNFADYGVASLDFDFSMSAFDFASETSDLDYATGLTISEQSVSPSCGCGPVGLFLSLGHNISKSSFISSFMKRSGIQFADSATLRHVSSDSSWRYNKHFVGRGRDGVSFEDLHMMFSLSCSEGFWEFSFYANTHNRSTGDELYTKFIIDIPSDTICSDGSISTVIEMDLNTSGFGADLGESVNVVTPARSFPPRSNSRSPDVFVDGVFNQTRIYYDGMGIFKNSYWTGRPLRITINNSPSEIMSEIEIHRIFN